MAYELKTIFTVKDNASSAMRRMLKQVQSLDRAINQLSNNSKKFSSNLNHNNSTINNATRTIIRNTTVINNNSSMVTNNTNTINRNTGARNTLIGAVGRESSAFKGLGSVLGMLGGAYAVAAGGSKLFSSTIGAASNFEQSATVLKAMMNDADKYKQYVKMIDSIAIDSPLLNSADMFSGSKGLLTMTKSLETLESSWKTISKLVALNPMQGVEGAVYSLKGLQSGDVESIVDRFDMNRKDINPLKGLSFGDQIKGLDKVLAKMNVTDQLVKDMSQTSLGQYNSLLERISTFLRDIGEESNTSLGKFLTRLNKGIDKLNVTSLSNKLGDMLNSVTNKAIAFAGWLWKWKEPIAYAAGALTAAATAFVGVGIIAALANPVSLIAAGIAGTAVGMKALYDNSETFRGAIAGAVGRAKELWAVFKEGGIGGVMSEILPPSMSETIQRIIASVGQLFGAFKTGGVTGLLETLLPEGMLAALQARFATIKDQFTNTFTAVYNAVVPILQTAWSLVSPILSALGTALKVVADIAMLAWNNVLSPAIQFAAAAIQTMWKIAGPIFELLGAVIQTAFSVLKIAWDTIIGPFVAFLAGAFTTGFGMATEVVKALSPVFEKLGGFISTAADYLKTFAEWLGKIKVPDWIGKIGGSAVNFAQKLVPGHYHGLKSVPYDGYVASLHKHEMILTRQEADAYRSMMGNGFDTGSSAVANVTYQEASTGVVNNAYTTQSTVNNHNRSNDEGSRTVNVNIPKIADHIIVREEADIEKITMGIAELVAKEALTGHGF